MNKFYQRILGIFPKDLSPIQEEDLKIFYDAIHKKQRHFLRNLRRCAKRILGPKGMP